MFYCPDYFQVFCPCAVHFTTTGLHISLLYYVAWLTCGKRLNWAYWVGKFLGGSFLVLLSQCTSCTCKYKWNENGLSVPWGYSALHTPGCDKEGASTCIGTLLVIVTQSGDGVDVLCGKPEYTVVLGRYSIWRCFGATEWEMTLLNPLCWEGGEKQKRNSQGWAQIQEGDKLPCDTFRAASTMTIYMFYWPE